ncbi:glycosyltransferase [Blastococcus sp. SYSU D00813]
MGASMRSAVLHDVSPHEARLGMRRRIGHLVEHEEGAGHTVDVLTVLRAEDARAARAVRVRDALSAPWRLPLSRYDRLVVEALSAPHMVVLAGLLRRSGFSGEVLVDVCDSHWMLTAQRPRDRLGAARLRQTVSYGFDRLAFRMLPRDVQRSYISEADAAADRRADGSFGYVVIPPSPIPELAALPVPQGPPTSILVPADTTTDQGREAIAELAGILSRASLSARVEITGDRPADTPAGIAEWHWLGRVPSIADVYDRPAVVVSTNPASHGVQLKLWEAVQARRPVIAYASALQWAPEVDWVHRVRDRDDFADRLRSVLLGTTPGGARGEGA